MSHVARLLILKQAQGYAFQWQWPAARRNAATLWTYSSPTEAANLQGQLEREVALLNAQFMRRGLGEAAEGAASQDHLRALGRLIYYGYFPPALQRALRELPPDTAVIIATNDPQIPWELAHDEQTYLALKHPLGRHLVLDQPLPERPARRDAPWRCLLIGNPTGDLDSSQNEAVDLDNLLRTVPGTAPARVLMRGRARKEAVLRELASGEYALIHYSGHAVCVAQHPEASGLVLARGEILTLDEIARYLGGDPLVFLNACGSAQDSAAAEPLDPTAYWGQLARSVAAAFVQGGARLCLGTFWSVLDASSRAFALDFYRRASQGESIGEALRQTRVGTHARDPLNPIWASYMLYGDPRLPLLKVPHTRSQPATVLVARLRGIESLSASLSDEEAARITQAYGTALRNQVTHHGGQVLSLAHDTLLSAFGLPLTQANDAERAVRAALAMIAALPPLRQRYAGHGLTLGLGLGSGRVLGQDTGEDALPAPCITGPALNDAAWLAQHAERDTVLAAASTQDLIGDLAELAPVTLAAPQEGQSFQAYRVLGLRYAQANAQTPRVHPLPLAGRVLELARLQEAWQDCLQGQGQIVSLEGEAGVGKSRLLYALQEYVGEEAQWLPGVCPLAYNAAPYELVAQVLRTLWDLAPSDEPSVNQGKLRLALQALLPDCPEPEMRLNLANLGDILGLPFPEVSWPQGDAVRRQGLTLNVLERLLTSRAEQCPLVLALEDLDRADDASLKVIDKLAPVLSQLPVLLIALYRSEAQWTPPWAARDNHQRVRLNPLRPKEVQDMLAAILGADLTRVGQSLTPIVDARARGNPLFIRELVSMIQERGLLEGPPEPEQPNPLDVQRLPGSLERLVLMRIESLPPEARAALPIAVVAGDELESAVCDVVVAETGRMPFKAGLAELEKRGLIRLSQNSYRFTHALIQETAYAHLSEDERRRYHRLLGRALEQVYAGREAEALERLAHHYYRSLIASGLTGVAPGVLPDGAPDDLARAEGYLLQAGLRANQRYAARTAAAHYRRALRVIRGLAAAPGPRGLIQRRETSVHGAQACEGLGEAYNLQANFPRAINAYRLALHKLDAALPGARDVEAAELQRRAADLARRIGRLYGWQAHYDAAAYWMEQGLQRLAGRLDDAARATAALLHLHSGTLDYYRGQYDEALAHIERGLGIVEGTEHLAVMAEGHNLLGAVYDARGQRERAIAHYQESLGLWEKLHDDYQVARVRDNVGVVYFHLGQWPQAEAAHRQALGFLERIGDRDQVTYAALNLGNVHLCRGEWDAAETLFARAQVLSEQVGNPRILSLARLNLGLVALERADWAAARRELQHSLALLEEHHIEDFLVETYTALGRLSLGEGDARQALEWGHRALTLAQKLEMGLEQGLARRVVGLAYHALGDLAQAEAHLRAGVDMLTSLGHRYELARTLLPWARVRAQGGDVAAAREELGQALALLTELGARADLAAAQGLWDEVAGKEASR